MSNRTQWLFLSTINCVVLCTCFTIPLVADDWPMRGRDGTRNAVSPEMDPPTLWSVEERSGDRLLSESRGVRWSMPLGSETYSSPVVSGGLVWIGTNSYNDSTNGVSSVLKCFRVSDGAGVYEYDSRSLGNRKYDAGWSGLGSSPLIEGDRLWLATNRSEVLCLDIGPLLRGDGVPRELWRLDFVDEFGTYPRVPVMGPPRPCSIGASWNNHIFVTVNHGISYDEKQVDHPEAPSLVCLNKLTGAIVWQDSSPGENILLTQFASPTLATIQGDVQVIVPQSDGWVRAFHPSDGSILWEFDLNFKTSVYYPGGGNPASRNYGVAEAVVYNDLVYLASGQGVEYGGGPGRLVCIDPTKRGDTSSELAVDAKGEIVPRRRLQAVDITAGEKAIPNPNSALVWEFTNCGTEYTDIFDRTLSSVSVAQDLVYATDMDMLLYCLDANTGQRLWFYELDDIAWGAPLIVDDKVFVAHGQGKVSIFQLGADPACAEPIRSISHANEIRSNLAYANDTLYVAARSVLYAIGGEETRPANVEFGYWPQWRGANRDNRSTETGLLKSWPEQGPPLAWRVDGLGDGIASLAIADGRIFTTTTYGNAEYAVALDERTGEQHWITEIGSAVPENPLMRWLGQRTPTVDGNRIYVFTNAGWLTCLDATDGLIRWRISYPHEFGVVPLAWGCCERPLIDHNKLICTAGGSQGTVIALDKLTGKTLWNTLLDSHESAAYATTIQLETDGLKQYIAFLERGIVSLAADDGRVLWRYDRISSPIVNTHSPVVLPDGLLCPNGYGGCLARLKLSRLENTVDYEELFFTKEKFDPFEDSSLLVKDHLYVLLTEGWPACIDVKSGNTVWKAQGSGRGKAAATYADEHLYIRWADGTIGLAEANPSTYAEKSHFKLDEPRKSLGSTHPVVAGGALYIRDNDRLLKYDVSQPAFDTLIPASKLINLDQPKESKRQPLPTGQRIPTAIFVPTPNDVVSKMLEMAQVGKDDVVTDLGSGDGRILIEAAKQYACRAVGIELDKDLVELSQKNVAEAKVAGLVKVKSADMFEADFSDATVVTAYVYRDMLQRLLPQFKKLKPGSRIVTHQFDIPAVKPEKTLKFVSRETGAEHTLYLWTTPLESDPKKN